MSTDDGIKPVLCNNSDNIDDHHVFKRKSKSSGQIQSQATCKKSSSPTFEATELNQCNQNGIYAENLTGKKPNGEVKTSDCSDYDKPLNFIFKQPSAAINSSVFDDSDDEKPVSSLKRPSAAVKKEVSADSGDELPLGVIFSKKLKSNGTHMSSSSHSMKKEATIIDTTVDSEDEKPLSDLKSYGSNSKKRLSKEIQISTSSPSKRAKVKEKSSLKQKVKINDDDNVTIGQIMKKSVSLSNKSLSKKVTKNATSSALRKKGKKLKKTASRKLKISKTSKVSPETGSEKKWTTFEHNGVMFPLPYKPHGIKMLYNGSPVDLTPEQEEVATMFAVMKDTDYASKPTFIDNFMNDWRQILGGKHIIKKFELCDFTPIYEWHLKEKEKKKLMTTEEKKALKEDKLKQEEKYTWAIVDGVKEKVGNFRVEPPGLFRGRGEHPKMGKLKRRIHPSDITINIGKDAPIPQCPNPGERWKEVRHDNTVTWLAFWTDPINNREGKYVYLAPSSSLKGQSDKEKYEKARLLKDYIEDIRTTYTRNFSSKDPIKRQIAVATYLIDKLALRAGNEKDDDEADTVGCCTLKVENVECIPNSNKLQFDFLGKDSIRYFNTVEVEMPVYKAIEEFKSAKKSDGQKKNGGDDIFDLLDTNKLNAHLRELMPGLTAKVFRTYNASITLDNMLYSETKDGTVPEKLATYQLANKEVAIICNHQRAVSKGHDTSMSRLDEKIDALKSQREEVQKDLDRAKKGKPPLQDKEGKTKKSLTPEVLESKLANFDARIKKLGLDKSTREELKTVALGTSKVNYLDPRISVAWCKRNEVPIEKIFNRSLLAKFAWSMDVEPSYRF